MLAKEKSEFRVCCQIFVAIFCVTKLDMFILHDSFVRITFIIAFYLSLSNLLFLIIFNFVCASVKLCFMVF